MRKIVFVKTLLRTVKSCPRSHFRTKLQSANMAFFVGSSAIYLSIFPSFQMSHLFIMRSKQKMIPLKDLCTRFSFLMWHLRIELQKIPSHGRSNYSFVCKYAKEGFAEATVEKEELGEKHFNHIYWPFPFHIPRVVKKWPFVEGLLPQSSTWLVFLWILLKGVSISEVLGEIVLYKRVA